ncbi:MAG: hypothetical protein ACREP2_08190 [Rhodanobacteraceae bacterium]
MIASRQYQVQHKVCSFRTQPDRQHQFSQRLNGRMESLCVECEDVLHGGQTLWVCVGQFQEQCGVAGSVRVVAAPPHVVTPATDIATQERRIIEFAELARRKLVTQTRPIVESWG